MFSSARCEAGDEHPPFPTLGKWFSKSRHMSLTTSVDRRFRSRRVWTVSCSGTEAIWQSGPEGV